MSVQRPHIFYASDLDRADQWRAALAGHFDSFEFSTSDDLRAPETVDVALIWRVPSEGLERFSNLRAVLSLGAGVNQIALDRLPGHVPLAKLADTTLTRQMTEYAKAAVYRYHRRLHVFEARTRIGRWQFELPLLTSQTSIAVLGLGTIGRAIAEALQKEGFNVGAWSRRTHEIEGMRTYSGRTGLLTLVAECDIVVNVLPLTSETRDLFDRALFREMRQGSKLINMGRGESIVETDLLEALTHGPLEAATLDVTAVEPLPQSHPFWNHPAILVTPHVAGVASPETAAAQLAENIRRSLAGKPLLNQVDTSAGY